MKVGERELVFGERTFLMAVLNMTPDSFSGDGLGDDVRAACDRARRFAAEGADLLDVGGESTRPGAEPVSQEEELRRVVPVVRALKSELDLPVSIDTRHAAVAAAALSAGADLVNDVSGLTHDPDLAGVVAAAGVPVVLQHTQGTPRTMQVNPVYQDVVDEVADGLAERLALAEAAGIDRARCLIDPGLGFGKRLEHNLRLVRRLGELRRLGCPILIGPSRKSFIGTVLGTQVEDRIEGTAAVVALCIAHGADLVRVHDVAPMARVVRMCDAVVRGRLPEPS